MRIYHRVNEEGSKHYCTHDFGTSNYLSIVTRSQTQSHTSRETSTSSGIKAILLFTGDEEQKKDGEKRIPATERKRIGKQTSLPKEHGLNIWNKI